MKRLAIKIAFSVVNSSKEKSDDCCDPMQKMVESIRGKQIAVFMITFITTNKRKINSARRNLVKFDIEVEGVDLSLEEIQSKDIAVIATHKAKQAYAQLQKPLVVSDHGWFITALHGFPGAYMKEVEQWLSAQDFLNLMKPYANREIIKKEVLCFIDGEQTKTFMCDMKAEVLHSFSGEGKTVFDCVKFIDSGKVISDCIKESINSTEQNTIWKDFASWYKSYSQ